MGIRDLRGHQIRLVFQDEHIEVEIPYISMEVINSRMGFDDAVELRVTLNSLEGINADGFELVPRSDMPEDYTGHELVLREKTEDDN